MNWTKRGLLLVALSFFLRLSCTEGLREISSPTSQAASLMKKNGFRKQIKHKIGSVGKISNPAPPPSLIPLHTTIFLVVSGSAFVAFSPTPALIERLGTVDATKMLSILSATAALFEISFSPAVGSIMDSMGRKPVLVSAVLPILFANLFVSLSPSVVSISLSKMISSIAVSMAVLASQTMIADLNASQPERLSAAIGVQVSILSFAFLCGALAAANLSRMGLKRIYATSSAIIASAASSAVLMKETLSPETSRPARQENHKWIKSPLSSIRIFRHKNLRLLVLLLMISTLPQNMGDVFQIFCKSEWNIEAQDYASFISLFAVIGIFGNIVGSALVKRIGIVQLTRIACFSSSLAPIGTTLFQFRGTVVGALLGFLGFAQGLGITASLVEEGRKSGIPQGELAGERSAVLALVKVIGPIWYSMLYVQGSRWFGLSNLPFVFNVCLAGLGFVLSLRYLH